MDAGMNWEEAEEGSCTAAIINKGGDACGVVGISRLIFNTIVVLEDVGPAGEHAEGSAESEVRNDVKGHIIKPCEKVNETTLLRQLCLLAASRTSQCLRAQSQASACTCSWVCVADTLRVEGTHEGTQAASYPCLIGAYARQAKRVRKCAPSLRVAGAVLRAKETGSSAHVECAVKRRLRKS
jgi:hypothetical protein